MTRAKRALMAIMLALLSSAPALAQSDGFYKGKTLSIYVGFGGGGSYDFYAHLIARHIGKHLPGTPNVIAQSMPGAGSFKLGNWLTSVAPKDGTAIGIISQAAALEEALDSPGVQFRTRDFAWIGRATSVIEIMMTWNPARATTLKDALEREVLIGGTGPGSPSEGYPKLLNAGAGTKFRIIAGYPASADVLLAIQKGEVDAAFTSFGSLSAYHPDWIAQKKINMIVQGTVGRTSELPDVPAVGELGRTPDDRQMLQLYASTSQIGRSFIAPPGLPLERIEMLRKAFDATMNDPEFRAEVAKAKVEFHPLPGAELQKIIAATAETPPNIIARMKGLLTAK